ncbi:uncharacterized protein LOC110990830 [Acanthaster planci]|uniref:Uncharacterized protein LOC110990830 n=1 Tax=Acanthaster planci TaxID=133434 RepID=A0A8B8A3V8_ACAPL|nr:uncharacterized protein LOC110990830 [Acanthaster planci]
MAKQDAGFVVLTLTLCMGMVILAFGYQCNPLRKTLYVAENRSLRGFTYAHRSVRSIVICGRDCSLDERCKSFNFNGCDKMCELNLATRREHPGNFSAIQGSVYLDDDADTPRYSLNGTSDCMVLDHDITNCQEWLDAGYNTSDVYTIYPMQYQNGLQVYCDMKKDESRWMGLQGGWIVFQRRQDGSVNFTRSWAEYRDGFGNLTGEFWLGNEYLRQLTGEGRWELLVELLARRPDTSLVRYLAWYRTFNITGEQYTLHVGDYTNSLYLSVCDVADCRVAGT